MNFLFAILILVAYIFIHARKANVPVLDWIKDNVITTICAAVIVIGVTLVPTSVLAAVATWTLTPILVGLALQWGAVSLLSNVFTVVSDFFKMLFKDNL